MDWVKTRIIIILSVILGLSLIANGVFSWLVFKQGLKVERKTYITTNTSSDSYSSSGALNINILGQQQYWNGKFELKKKEFKTYEESFLFAQTLNICNWEVAKIIPHIVAHNEWNYGVWYQDFVTQTSEVKKPVVTTKEILDK